MNYGELAVGVFLDLSKAFDTVNPSILFEKLEHYGIRGLALKWIKSYFSNRLQFVEYIDYVSSCANIMCGVPQGSILGPLFFLLYINDIINTSTILQLILFADDTNVFVSHKDKDCLTSILNAELNKLSLWFRANRLSLIIIIIIIIMNLLCANSMHICSNAHYNERYTLKVKIKAN